MSVYKENESKRHFCGMINGLAFLPTNKSRKWHEFFKKEIGQATFKLF